MCRTPNAALHLPQGAVPPRACHKRTGLPGVRCKRLLGVAWVRDPFAGLPSTCPRLEKRPLGSFPWGPRPLGPGETRLLLVPPPHLRTLRRRCILAHVDASAACPSSCHGSVRALQSAPPGSPLGGRASRSAPAHGLPTLSRWLRRRLAPRYVPTVEAHHTPTAPGCHAVRRTRKGTGDRLE